MKIDPIFIPTVGRAAVAYLPRVLEDDNLPYTLVVEPQERKPYSLAFPDANLLVLPEKGRGVHFARQTILNHARAEGIERYWQCDDNIRSFESASNRKVTAVGPRVVMGRVQELADEVGNVALAAPEYQQFLQLPSLAILFR